MWSSWCAATLSLAGCFALASGCHSASSPGTAGPGGSATSTSKADLSEHDVQLLPVGGALAQRKSEISGFAWYKDRLIVLPQRPATWNPTCSPGCFSTLDRAAIERAVAGDPTPLEAQMLPVRGVEKITSLEGVQGLEAIALQGERVFMLVEAQSKDRHMRGYLALGHVEGNLDAIVIDSVSSIELPAQTGVDNLSYEAVVATPDQVVAIYEANGALNPTPRVLCFDPAGQHIETKVFPHIEYRITDAAPPDPGGYFWTINYFYPPELALACNSDELNERFGVAAPPPKGVSVERLVRMRIDKGAITLAPDPPIRLRTIANQPRNWEALAVLPGKGFIIATDMYPATMMGFVRYPVP